jgi:hypothetical protein
VSRMRGGDVHHSRNVQAIRLARQIQPPDLG